MHITYTASEDDFVRAGLLMLRKKSGASRVLPWLGAVTLVAIAVVALAKLLGGEPVAWSSQMPRLAAPFFIAIFMLSFPFLGRRAMRRQYRSAPILAETRTVQADFSGVHF